MLYVKAENLQVTGAYKPRAAASVVASMAPEHLKNGIALSSSGNFAQAFALLGRLARIPVVVVMLDRTSQYKVDAARKLGAEVVFCGLDALARQPTVEAIARERGMVAIDTWEDPAIAIGHASIGIEISGRFLGRRNSPRPDKQRRGSGRHSRGHQRERPEGLRYRSSA